MNSSNDILGNVLGSLMGGGAPAAGGGNPLGGLLGGIAGGRAGANPLVGAAFSLLQQHGGLPGVLEMFRRSGMAAQADSWVSTGPNQGISADQLQQALGGNALGQIAGPLGLSPGQAGASMAQMLPELINLLTPRGQVPDDHQDLVSRGLAMLQGK